VEDWEIREKKGLILNRVKKVAVACDEEGSFLIIDIEQYF
jgi:hypothetical protein